MCCVGVVSPTLSIYWVDLCFINNHKNLNHDYSNHFGYILYVASNFFWVITNGIKSNPTTPQMGRNEDIKV